MICLELLLSFLKVGVLSFGGGMGMIPIMKSEVLSHGWLSEDMFYNIVAIAESTPGPIAINMATYVGQTQAGFLGAFLATFGVVFPAFVIILIIASLLKNFMKNKYVNGTVSGIIPVVIGMLLATGIFLALQLVLINFQTQETVVFSYVEFLIIMGLLGACIGYRAWRKKELNPIIMLLIAGAIGAACL